MSVPRTWSVRRPTRAATLAANRELVVLSGIVAAGVVVRFATLGHQSYDHDEAVTAWRVLRGGLGGTLRVVASSERSPPLYYLLAWPWARVLGTGEVGLRSLSALAGAGTIPAAYLAARELASGRAGLVAASLVAFNPYLVWYSQEARSYALVVLFVAWGLYFFARCVCDPSRRNLALWSATSALALCSHYFAAFPVGAEGLLLVVRAWPRRAPMVALAATGAVGLALLPLAIAQEGTGRRNHFTTVPLLHRAAGTILEFVAGPEPGGLTGSLSVRYFRGAAALAAVVLAGVALVILTLRATSRERAGGLTSAGISGAAVILPIALAAGGLDFVDARNLIGALVPLLIAAGIGFGCARAGRAGPVSAAVAILVFLAVLAGGYVSGQMQRPDWRGAAAAMGPPSGPRVLVVPRNGNEPIAYYRDAREFRPPRFHEARVQEIDVLGSSGTITSPGRGFRLVERRGMAPCCTLWRFRARRPVPVRPQDFGRRRVLPERASVLVEGARATRARTSSRGPMHHPSSAPRSGATLGAHAGWASASSSALPTRLHARRGKGHRRCTTYRSSRATRGRPASIRRVRSPGPWDRCGSASRGSDPSRRASR